MAARADSVPLWKALQTALLPLNPLALSAGAAGAAGAVQGSDGGGVRCAEA